MRTYLWGTHGCRSLGREKGDTDDDSVSSLGEQVDTNTLNGVKEGMERITMNSTLAMVSWSCPRDMLGEVAGWPWDSTLMVHIEGNSDDLYLLTHLILIVSN